AEVASRPHDLVLGNLRPWRCRSRLPSVRCALPVSLQLLLQRHRRTVPPALARPHLAAVARYRIGLPAPCRRGEGAPACRSLAMEGRGCAAPECGDHARAGPRGAAPGADADRPEA